MFQKKEPYILYNFWWWCWQVLVLSCVKLFSEQETMAAILWYDFCLSLAVCYIRLKSLISASSHTWHATGASSVFMGHRIKIRLNMRLGSLIFVYKHYLVAIENLVPSWNTYNTALIGAVYRLGCMGPDRTSLWESNMDPPNVILYGRAYVNSLYYLNPQISYDVARYRLSPIPAHCAKWS